MSRGFEVPYGYRAKKGNIYLEIEPAEAEIVIRVFELRKMCPWSTLQEISDTLNIEGYRNRDGGKIDVIFVERILDEEGFYKGVYDYLLIKIKGILHKPIIK